MRPARLLPALLLAPALAVAGPPDAAPASPYSVLDPVNGTIRAVDLATHRLVLDADGKEVTLGLDRNTLVYLPSGLASVRALIPGAQVRAAANGQAVAYWVLVRSGPSGGTQPPPGQGTGPGGGTAPPAEGTAGPGAAGTAPPTTGSPGSPGGGANTGER